MTANNQMNVAYLSSAEKNGFGVMAVDLFFGRFLNESRYKVPERIAGIGSLGEIKGSRTVSCSSSETITHSWLAEFHLPVIMIFFTLIQ